MVKPGIPYGPSRWRSAHGHDENDDADKEHPLHEAKRDADDAVYDLSPANFVVVREKPIEYRLQEEEKEEYNGERSLRG